MTEDLVFLSDIIGGAADPSWTVTLDDAAALGRDLLLAGNCFVMPSDGPATHERRDPRTVVTYEALAGAFG